jgi:alkylation response protein AidB-like acyl-CoA dehydrogenase
VLTAEEQAFLDGPCEEVCRMTSDWETTHVRADLAPEVWDFLKRNKFFGMIISKEFGRPRLLGVCAFARDPEAGQRVGDPVVHRGRAELARPR